MPPAPPTSPPASRRLVILGAGYIGTALAKSALADGWAVSALTRNAARAAELRALGVSPVVEADLAGDTWHAALDPADAAVVNTVSPSTRQPAGYEHSFVAGTQSFTRWLEKSAAAGDAPARDVLFTSATSVYPQTDGGWVDETTPIPAASLSSTAAVLRAAEDLVLGLPPTLVRRAWVLRLGGLYGPGRHYLLDALRGGQRVFPGRGDTWVNLVHRDDVAAAIRCCLATAPTVPGGVFNVVDDHPVLKQDLLAGLARILGLDPASIRCDPGLPSDRARRRETTEGVIPHRRIANSRLKQLGFCLSYPSFETGFRQGLTPT
jgi:nucleoside-diphosphate-sugar epimerase